MPPVLMVLYSSDAVEVRYSDGSCLEISPCGSTMVHIDVPDRRSNPRQDQAKKIQKRTRFVTSEHRNKVVQALDFRNRFAERSYLCEELQSEGDIVALYAKIDSIAWPKLPEETKIEVLPDGSRRITSLDEFATMVVSPHGRDFTVCYLSRISEDRSGSKEHFVHRSDSTSLNSLRKPWQISSQPTQSQGTAFFTRPNEAVVHPFETAEHLNSVPVKCSNVPSFGTNNFQSFEDFKGVDQHLQHYNTHSSWSVAQLSSGRRHPDQNLAAYYVSAAEQRPETQGDDVPEKNLASDISFNNGEVNVKSHDLSGDIKYPVEPKNIPQSCDVDSFNRIKKCKPSILFSNDSPDSHDISSISRSSTPDGLRTTIDSEATFMHENMAEDLQGGVFLHKKRHSSPTQYTSSPNDVQSGVWLEKSALNLNESLNGSFLGCLKDKDQYEQNYNNCSMKQIRKSSDLMKDKSLSPTFVDSSSTMSTDSLELKNTRQHHLQSGSKHTGKQCHSDKHSPSANIDFSVSSKVLTNVRRLDSEVKTGHTVFETEPCYSDQAVNLLAEKCFDAQEIEKEKVAEKQHRHCYIWTTKHCSRNECPVVWTHPLKMLLEGTNLTNENCISHPTTRRLQASIASFKASDQKSIFTTVPSPLPVTCPFHHNHKWSSSYHAENEDSNSYSGEFQHGKLKVVISEGIVYRLGMKVVEIYPGDGSVLVSEGIKGHFFTHSLLVGDQLEERTYSLKSLPPRQLKGPYSIEKLIATASRFLKLNEQWEQRSLREDIPCWKKEVVAVIEPLPSSLLEECHVTGLGKFSAFTNGRVRVVFEDRTTLDVVCNFSRRVNKCLHHSHEPQVSLPGASCVSPAELTTKSIFGASTGRLMLPSGKYVTVDINKPGPYRKYTQAAMEWAAWVSSSPLERHQFYTHHNMPAVLQQAAELELKKIFCFKYILEQTMLIHQQQLKGRNSEMAEESSTEFPKQNVDFCGAKKPASSLRASDHQNNAMLSHYNLQTVTSPPGQRQVFLQPSGPDYRAPEPNASSSNSLVVYQNPTLNSTCTGKDCARTKAFGTGSAALDWATRAEWSSNRKSKDIVLGFESVRRVLLQNSDLINDINQFLESNRKT